MFKRLSILVALLILCLVSGAYAATDLFSVKASDNQIVKIDSLGKMLGQKATIEVATTNDTVTAIESGKVFLPNISSGTITFTLPTAKSGLQYTFSSINGHATSGQGTVILSPKSTDKFVGCVNSSATSSFANGDDLDSPQATGDSVTIVGASTKWYCINRIGTWVDGN